MVHRQIVMTLAWASWSLMPNVNKVRLAVLAQLPQFDVGSKEFFTMCRFGCCSLELPLTGNAVQMKVEQAEHLEYESTCKNVPVLHNYWI